MMRLVTYISATAALIAPGETRGQSNYLATVGEWSIASTVTGCAARRGADSLAFGLPGTTILHFSFPALANMSADRYRAFRLNAAGRMIDIKRSGPLPATMPSTLSSGNPYLDHSGPKTLLQAFSKPAAIKIEYLAADGSWKPFGPFEAPQLDRVPAALESCAARLTEANRPPELFRNVKPRDFQNVCPLEGIGSWDGIIQATVYTLSVKTDGMVHIVAPLFYRAEANSDPAAATRYEVSRVIQRLRYHPATDASGKFVERQITYSAPRLRCT